MLGDPLPLVLNLSLLPTLKLPLGRSLQLTLTRELGETASPPQNQPNTRGDLPPAAEAGAPWRWRTELSLNSMASNITSAAHRRRFALELYTASMIFDLTHMKQLHPLVRSIEDLRMVPGQTPQIRALYPRDPARPRRSRRNAATAQSTPPRR